MPPRRTQPPDVPPSLTPQRAVELIKSRFAAIPELSSRNYRDPEIDKWKATTIAILGEALGKPYGNDHEMTRKFRYLHAPPLLNAGEGYFQKKHQEIMLERKAVLESVIEQLEILAPPIARVAEGQYVFHAEIEKVSGHLFRDGHYKQAALEAYIRVIEEVKQRSGLVTLDGDDLMNKAFSFDPTRMPVVRFSTLSDDAERDLQKGFMFMFKGMVAHRNFKAHSNQLFNDPLRAHDYLSFASLLMRALEFSTK